MSDTVLRAIQRLYLKGSVTLDAFLPVLQRHDAIIWDWVAGGLQFYELTLEQKVAIFLQKWPIDVNSLDQERLSNMIDHTYKRGNGVYWDATHPDTPSAAEILNETIGDLAYWYGRRTPPNPWIPSFSNFVAEEVENNHYLIVVLKHYNVL